jgi:uncharacterized protein
VIEQHKACSDFERDITRYAYASDLTDVVKVRVEKHLKDCNSCSELVAFIRQSLNVIQRDPNAHTDDLIPSCVDTDTIVAFGEGRLHGTTRDRVREHILNCASCRDEYLVWCSLDDAYIGPEVLVSSDKSTERSANKAAEEPSQAMIPDYLGEIAEPLREEYKRLALEHTQYSQRIDFLDHKRYLSQEEKLEQVRLKKLKLRLKDEMERLKEQSEKQIRLVKNKRA